jgi:cell division protein FtsW (lipid II flippase)
LLSFELLMLFAVPGIIVVIVMALRRYRTTRDRAPRAILIAAIALILVNVAYFGYYALGITESLWDGGAGFYFSANDVLHVGMIAWLIYVAAALGPTLTDRVSPE